MTFILHPTLYIMATFRDPLSDIVVTFTPKDYVELRRTVLVFSLRYIDHVELVPRFQNDVSLVSILKREGKKIQRHLELFVAMTKEDKPPRKLDAWAFTMCDLLGLKLFIEKIEVYRDMWKYSTGQCVDMKEALYKINHTQRINPTPSELIDRFIDMLTVYINAGQGCFMEELEEETS
jgi:hypothetical protein